MFTFDWAEFVTDEVIKRLYASLDQLPPDPLHPEVVPLTATVLGAVGGIPVVDTLPSQSERVDIAIRLLDDACRHTLQRGAASDTLSGHVLIEERNNPFRQRAAARRTVNVNTATIAELAALPGIGPQLARRIVSGRRTGGAYVDAQDLARRVQGIGSVISRRLRHVLSFVDATALMGINATSFEARVRAIVALSRSEVDADPIPPALDLLCTACSGSPHPSAQDRRRRTPPQPLPATMPTDWIGVLANDAYHSSLAQAFSEATTAIDVCMFHIALGNPGHPTEVLLNALVAAGQRGVAVRVLLDRDRDTDPYRSTVINARARGFLADRGVPVRSDPEETLLHSKFVIVDNLRVVLGSHNWSVGSYQEFDDMSVMVASAQLAQHLTARFDTLWDAGS